VVGEHGEQTDRVAARVHHAGEVVSMTAGGTVVGTDLDLTLRSTAGCAPLPELDQLREQLRQAGFMSVVSTSLVTRARENDPR